MGKRNFYYILVIDKIKTEELREKIKNLSEECPEEILNNEITRSCEIYRFYRRNMDKYPVFLNKKYDNPHFAKKNNKTLCSACGLSVFLEKEDLIFTIKNKFPKNQKFILLKAKFSVEIGKLYKTGSDSHCDFFPYKNFNHDKFFEKFEEINLKKQK